MEGLQNTWDAFTHMIDPEAVNAPQGLPDYGKPYIPPDSTLNFEQRVLRPSAYPHLTDKDGKRATHKMAYAGVDDGQVAYPTIILGPDGKLKRLGDDAAFEYAMKTGEFRKFGTEREAADYARGGYKQQWGSGEPKRGLLDILTSFGKNK